MWISRKKRDKLWRNFFLTGFGTTIIVHCKFTQPAPTNVVGTKRRAPFILRFYIQQLSRSLPRAERRITQLIAPFAYHLVLILPG